MTDLYRCTHEHHNGDICIGFCLNENCQYPSLICFQCMRDQHFKHQNDCQGFVTMQKWLGKMLDDQRNVVDSLKNTLQELIEQQKIIHKKHKLLYDTCLIFQQNLYENNFNFFKNTSLILSSYTLIRVDSYLNHHKFKQFVNNRELLLNLDNIQPFVQSDNIIRIEQGQYIQDFQKDVMPPYFQQQFNQQYFDQNPQNQEQQMPQRQKYQNRFPSPLNQRTIQNVQYYPLTLITNSFTINNKFN